ncbi:hypothetical protein [Bacteroides caecimuris]|uniref:hypothetical protein n=1 Tax=Bacteroides caecimuris TaxID=1796613 RepID=UPI00138F80BE|nr:hypothetical protein [Bacteroides caecimuris]
MKLGERVSFEIPENGIPYGLPLLEVFGQVFNGKVVLLTYIGQIFPVCSGRVGFDIRHTFAISAIARCTREYGNRNGNCFGYNHV